MLFVITFRIHNQYRWRGFDLLRWRGFAIHAFQLCRARNTRLPPATSHSQVAINDNRNDPDPLKEVTVTFIPFQTPSGRI